jgi:hypothetical protein
VRDGHVVPVIYGPINSLGDHTHLPPVLRRSRYKLYAITSCRT